MGAQTLPPPTIPWIGKVRNPELCFLFVSAFVRFHTSLTIPCHSKILPESHSVAGGNMKDLASTYKSSADSISRSCLTMSF